MSPTSPKGSSRLTSCVPNNTGCAGFAAVASDVSFSTDVEQVITPAINLSIAALEAATATPTIKRFVQTASSAAASADVPWGTEHDLPADSYNTRAVEIAYAGDKSDPALGVWVYSASKVKQEQAVWAFREAARTKAGGAGALPFEISTVLPDFVVGEVLSPADQGYPTSVGVLRQVWDGDMAMASVMPPQYEVDARDTALLHVAALLHPGVAGERLFAYGERKNWANTLALWRELYPGRTFPDPPEGEQEYKANVLARPRAEEVLKWVKGSGFTDYKTSLKELGEQFLGESR